MRKNRKQNVWNVIQLRKQILTYCALLSHFVLFYVADFHSHSHFEKSKLYLRKRENNKNIEFILKEKELIKIVAQ